MNIINLKGGSAELPSGYGPALRIPFNNVRERKKKMEKGSGRESEASW